MTHPESVVCTENRVYREEEKKGKPQGQEREFGGEVKGGWGVPFAFGVRNWFN